MQERLGHASVAMTFDVYSHLFRANEERTGMITDDALAELSAGKSDLAECNRDLGGLSSRPEETRPLCAFSRAHQSPQSTCSWPARGLVHSIHI